MTQKSFLLCFLSFIFISPLLAWIAYKCQRVNAIHTYHRLTNFEEKHRPMYGVQCAPLPPPPLHWLRMYTVYCVSMMRPRDITISNQSIYVSQLSSTTTKILFVRHAEWLDAIQFICHGSWCDVNRQWNSAELKSKSYQSPERIYFSFCRSLGCSFVEYRVPSPYSFNMCACVSLSRHKELRMW